MSNKQFTLVFFSLLLLHSLVILNINFFPFIDVPSHLAEGTIFKYYNESSNNFAKYYTLHYSFYPNTFHLFFFQLPIFKNVEFANKILHLIIVTGLPITVYLIIVEIKGNKWFAIISFILVYGYNLSFGFTGNAAANDIALLILWLWLRSVNSNNNYYLNIIFITVLLTSVYFFHAMIALFCLLMISLFLLYRFRNNFVKIFLNSFILLPLITLITYWWFFLQKSAENNTQFDIQDTANSFSLTDYYKYDFFPTFYKRDRFLVADNSQLFTGHTGTIVASALSFIILIPFFILIINFLLKKYKLSFLANNIVKDNFIYILLFFIANTACYLFLPIKIPGQAPLYERFSTMVLLSLILIGSKIPGSNNKIFSYTCILIAIIHLGLWAQYFNQFDEENKNFTSILPNENNKILSYMNYDPSYRGRMVYDHFQNYFIVQKKGITTSKIIDYRFGMIRRKKSGDLPPQGHTYYHDNPRAAIMKSDYILVRGTVLPDHQKLLDSLHVFSVVKDVGQWHLLKRM